MNSREKSHHSRIQKGQEKDKYSGWVAGSGLGDQADVGPLGVGQWECDACLSVSRRTPRLGSMLSSLWTSWVEMSMGSLQREALQVEVFLTGLPHSFWTPSSTRVPEWPKVSFVESKQPPGSCVLWPCPSLHFLSLCLEHPWAHTREDTGMCLYVYCQIPWLSRLKSKWEIVLYPEASIDLSQL